MTGGRTIVFVHGKGGFESRQAWLGPLNTGLSALGYPVIGAHGDRIIEADYLVALNNLAYALEKLQKPEEARSTYQAVLAMEAENKTALKRLKTLERRAGIDSKAA